MNTAKAKMRKNKIIEILSRINELKRSRSYLQRPYFLARMDDLENELNNVGRSIRKEEKIHLKTDEDYEQYLVLYE